MVWVKIVYKMRLKYPDMTLKMSGLMTVKFPNVSKNVMLKCPDVMVAMSGNNVQLKCPDMMIKMSGLITVKCPI